MRARVAAAASLVAARKWDAAPAEARALALARAGELDGAFCELLRLREVRIDHDLDLNDAARAYGCVVPGPSELA